MTWVGTETPPLSVETSSVQVYEIPSLGNSSALVTTVLTWSNVKAWSFLISVPGSTVTIPPFGAYVWASVWPSVILTVTSPKIGSKPGKTTSIVPVAVVPAAPERSGSLVHLTLPVKSTGCPWSSSTVTNWSAEVTSPFRDIPVSVAMSTV